MLKIAITLTCLIGGPIRMLIGIFQWLANEAVTVDIMEAAAIAGIGILLIESIPTQE